jgi:hypothetical protein
LRSGLRDGEGFACEYRDGPDHRGTANLFMRFAPLEGWRHVEVTGRHTALDYAHLLKELSTLHFPNAARIVLVQDNLNTLTRSRCRLTFLNGETHVAESHDGCAGDPSSANLIE